MMFYVLATAEACDDLALANILSLLQTAFTIICIAVPIILIVSLIITLISAVTNPDQKDLLKKIVFKVLAAIIVFFLPSIVNVIMTWLPDNAGGFNVTSCWQAAREASGSSD